MGGPIPNLVSGKKLQYGRGQQVRRRMAIDLERIGIFAGQDFQIRVGFKRPREIVQLVVHARHDSRIRQPRADGSGNIDRFSA